MCGSLVPIILLGFFSHYYNYSTNNNLTTCWADPDTGATSPTIIDGYTNVTQEWHTLMLVGIIWATIHIVVVGIIVASPKLGLGI